jgi:hypothetical protein
LYEAVASFAGKIYCFLFRLLNPVAGSLSNLLKYFSMKSPLLISSIILVVLISCKKENNDPPTPPAQSQYFPPVGSSEWQSSSPSSLGWNESPINDLYTYLQSKGTKAFIVLKDGKIVIEKYFGSFTVDSNWYWPRQAKQ